MKFVAICLIFSLLCHAVFTETWSLNGYIIVPLRSDFDGFIQVKVTLWSGGLWDSECGSAVADVSGFFSIVCEAPFNVQGIKFLTAHHGFNDGVCYRSYFPDVELGDNKMFEITDEKNPSIIADINECLTRTY